MALGFATDEPAPRAVTCEPSLRGRGVPPGLRYYTPEIHVAAFAHPAWMIGAGGPLAMARIGIGGLHHETNSFAPQPATFERFVEADGWPPLLRGPAMLPGTAGINLAITGFVDAAHGRRARARAAGLGQCLPVGAGHRGRLRAAVGHAAGGSRRRRPARRPVPRPARRHGDRAPGRRRGRAAAPRRASVAPTLPIVAALDLHANVSEAMVRAQRRAGRLPHLPARRPRRHRRPLPAAARAPAGRRAPGQGVAPHRLPDPAALAVHDDRARARRSTPCSTSWRPAGALSASICMGFPAADTPGLRPVRARLRRRRRPRAEAAVDRLAAAFAAAEPRFAGRLWSARRGGRARHAARGAPGDPRRHPGQSGRRRQLRHDRACWRR